MPLDSRTVSESLETYVGSLLAESSFFSDLSAGHADPEHVRDVFGQFYLWRNCFHRWFGLCVAKSAPFGTGADVPAVLGELIACLAEEITGDHHGMARSFLAAVGIADPARVVPLPVTGSYAESFLCCYFSAEHSGDEALAALAGRELVGPRRNELIVRALRDHYGVASGLEFFTVHTDLEQAHFQSLWEALVHGTTVNPKKLIEAARLEIWEHITFWDDVYAAIAGAENRLVS
jgi:heme oxygenase-like protein